MAANGSDSSCLAGTLGEDAGANRLLAAKPAAMRQIKDQSARQLFVAAA